jgi:hypothetical protein
MLLWSGRWEWEKPRTSGERPKRVEAKREYGVNGYFISVSVSMIGQA